MNIAKGATEIINYTNKNLYWSNILLIPCILIGFFIIDDINHWSGINDTHKKIYLVSWIGITVYMCFVLLFSTLYHYTFFGIKWIDSTIKKIGQLDKITAKIFFILLIALNIIYISFINSQCLHDKKYEKITLIYIISCFFSILGVISWLLKQFFYKGYTTRGLMYKLKWIQTHSFFHYVTYTGVTLFFILYYFENKNIYDYIFLNRHEC